MVVCRLFSGGLVAEWWLFDGLVISAVLVVSRGQCC